MRRIAWTAWPPSGTVERVAARWGGTREDPFALVRRARSEPEQPPRDALREVVEAVVLTRGVRTVIQLGIGSGAESAAFTEMGVTAVYGVDPAARPEARAIFAADPALHLVERAAAAELPIADLYVLGTDPAADQTYAGVLMELREVLTHIPDAVVLVYGVLWPGGRRDPASAGPGDPAGGPATEGAGEGTGVLTAVEDALAEATQRWSLAVVPAVSGLAVLARDDASFTEELWEALLPWTTSELLALLERQRLTLHSRVTELRFAAELAAAEAADLRARLDSSSQRLDTAWDEIAELRATIAELRDDRPRPVAAALSRALRRDGDPRDLRSRRSRT